VVKGWKERVNFGRDKLPKDGAWINSDRVYRFRSVETAVVILEI
jgi:hypothetical protein